MKFLNFFLIFIFGLILGVILAYFFFNFYTETPSSFVSSPKKEPSFPEVRIKNSEAQTPILMYHHIRKPASKNKTEAALDVSPSNFEEQMTYLFAKGYKTISLEELLTSSWEKKFVITFDDGYKDVIENAYPILKRFDFKAMVFLIANDIGKEGYLNWPDIKILEKAGWSFGSHTLTHRNLLSLTEEEAEKEIAQSKEELDYKLKNPVNFFSYPAGKFNQDIIKIVKNAGYKGAVTTLNGKDNKIENIYQLKRIRINGQDTLEAFRKKVL